MSLCPNRDIAGIVHQVSYMVKADKEWRSFFKGPVGFRRHLDERAPLIIVVISTLRTLLRLSFQSVQHDLQRGQLPSVTRQNKKIKETFYERGTPFIFRVSSLALHLAQTFFGEEINSEWEKIGT